MDFTDIPRIQIYQERTFDELIDASSLNEKLTDNMFNILELRKGNFEQNVALCLNTAYYIYMVLRSIKRPRYKLDWIYKQATLDSPHTDLYKAVILALLLVFIQHSLQIWRQKLKTLVDDINNEMSCEPSIEILISSNSYPRLFKFQEICGILSNNIALETKVNTTLLRPKKIEDMPKNRIPVTTLTFEEVEYPPFLNANPNDNTNTTDDGDTTDDSDTSVDTTCQQLQSQLQALQSQIQALQSQIQALKDEKLSILNELLLPLFGNDDARLAEFLRLIAGQENKVITDLVARWSKENKLSSASCKRPLWKMLHAFKLYTASESNWNTALRNHP